MWRKGWERHNFADVDQSDSFMTRFDFNRGFVSLYDEFDFVSIGGHGDWAFGVNGKVEYRCCYGLGKKIVTARRKIEVGFRGILIEVLLALISRDQSQSIVMSPIDRCRFLALDDGTIKYDLPDVTKRYVDSHCKPRYSLINPDWNASSSDWSSSSTDEDDDEDDTPDKEEVSEDEEEEVVPKTGFVQGIAPKVSTSLRLLVTGARYQEPDYRRSMVVPLPCPIEDVDQRISTFSCCAFQERLETSKQTFA